MTTPKASEQALPQTALITGATGFIGGHLVRRLVRLGWKVNALTRKVSTNPVLAECVTWHTYQGDYASVSHAVAISKPDVVIHLASLFLSDHKAEQLDQLIDSNLRFGMHLLEAMRQNNITHFINTGTSWQHYNDAAYDPVNLYAATKQSFESVIDYYCNVHNLSAVTLKIFDTYGPNDYRGKIVTLINEAIKNQTELEMTDGNQSIHLVEISDVTQAFIKATELKNPGEHKKYGIPSNRAITIRDAAKLLERKHNKPLKALWGKKTKPARMMLKPPELPTVPGWTALTMFPNEKNVLD
jgi:nucleoside-diphosphate-sugar epimerase